MAEFLARPVSSVRRVFSRRVAVIAAVSIAVGAVGAGVAVAVTGGEGSPASSPGGGAVPTATVARTNLVSTVQEGGSIGYAGAFTIAAPAGASASEVSQEQQTVAEDEQNLSADEQAESDGSAASSQQVAADEGNVSTDQSTLSADEAKEASDCAGSGASSAACSADEQNVRQDQSQLTQAQQQLAAAQASAKQNGDQDQAKAASDQVKLQGDQATLTSLQATAINPGTTYTWLPQTGQVISQDQPVYAVSDEPVPLLYGSIPAYRAFYVGMSAGADIGELTHDLIALGYGDGLAQSNTYSQATAAAVQRWQSAVGLPATGEILLGEVVLEPGPIRVTSVTPSVGGPYGGGGSPGSGNGGSGTVLTATSTTPVVTVDLGVNQEYLVKPGDVVTVVLPNGTSTVNGQVESVGSVAACAGGSGTGTGNGASSGGGGSGGSSPCASAGSNGSAGSNSSPTVAVTISLNSTPAGAALDQAPVNVNITSQTADNVLAVPVTALLALSGGGYAVQVVTGPGSSHLTGVTTGMYTDTMVQVSGPGIRAGMRVEVPSS
jgi:Putative peptidoglycan binding domain